MATTQPDLLDDYIGRYCNWGRWGTDDQRGTANFIGPEQVRGAAQLIQAGQVVPLAIPIGQGGPQTGANGRFNCLRYSASTGSDHAAGAQVWAGQPFPRDAGFADDTIIMHLHTATHWDSLAHVFHKGRMYNGFPATDVTSDGARRNGSEQLCTSFVGRGVLLDIPAAKGVPWLDDGDAIGPADLDEAAAAERVEIRSGDILFVRTGQMARCRADGWGTYAGGDAPGLSLTTIPWLADHQIAAVASDTWGVEVRPSELPGSYQPLHLAAIVYLGLPLGEMFSLDLLAGECSGDGRYDFLVSAPPLPFTGTAGAPPGPVAIR